MTTEISGPIVFFGDSLSDPGNLFEAFEGIIDEDVRQDFGGAGGRASNGPVWTEQLGVVLESDEVVNYAQSGAQAIGSQTLGDLVEGLEDDLIVPLDDPALDFDINLGAQVDRFQEDFEGEDLSDFTAVMLIGANDLGTIDVEAPPFLVLVQIANVISGLAESTVAAAAELAESGVGHIVITSIPDLAFFASTAALSPEEQAVATSLSDQANAALLDGVALLEAQGVSASFLDLAPVTDAILDDTESFGLIAPYTETLVEGDPAILAEFDEDQVAFWDPIHPTEATHGVIAAYTAFALENEATILTDSADVILTGGADDLAFGYGEDDKIAGGVGADLLFGGSGDDQLTGNRGADLVSGGSGGDLLLGRRGDDVIDGDSGNDVISGGIGDDVMIDGLGSDVVLGNAGDDVFIWIEAELIGGTTGEDADIFDGGTGEDLLYLVLSSETADLVQVGLDNGDQASVLATLGISVSGTEDIVVIEERSGLEAALGQESWYAEADIWGLV